MSKLDIRPAFLTPTQRSSMLALKEQDRKIRRLRLADTLIMAAATVPMLFLLVVLAMVLFGVGIGHAP